LIPPSSSFAYCPDKSFETPYLEKNIHKKRAGGVPQGVDPEFKLQYCQKTKKKTKQKTNKKSV
jgi:hypothetical protein